MIPQKHKDKKLFKKIQYYLMLFRWFLIRRYHCPGSHKYKKYYNTINTLLWLFIMYSVIMTLATLISE